jgi:hypothetical protein
MSIALSSRFVKSLFESKSSLGFVLLNILRKAFHLILVAFGNLIGVQFLLISGLPLIPRVIGLFSIVTCYIGLRREYFPDFFFMRDLFAKFGVSRKNGRSSGDDGHGPEGQH